MTTIEVPGRGHERPGGLGPMFWSIASVGLRSGVLIAIAMLLIFVLLPAVLGAQAAAAP